MSPLSRPICNICSKHNGILWPEIPRGETSKLVVGPIINNTSSNATEVAQFATKLQSTTASYGQGIGYGRSNNLISSGRYLAPYTGHVQYTLSATYTLQMRTTNLLVLAGNQTNE